MLLSVPEIAEAEATGLVAELFQDIREVTGARLVNLVWRHLATDPAVFEWAWRAVRPGLQSGYLPARARLLRAQVKDAVRDWLPLDIPASAMSSAGTAEALAVVRTYSHTNCLNMMALSWLLEPASGSGPLPEPDRSPRTADRATRPMPNPLNYPEAPDLPTLPDLPPLPAWKQLDASLLRQIEQLNLMAESTAPLVVASLYRHLALWPPVLAMAAQVLTPLQQAGQLLEQRIATAQRAESLLNQSRPPSSAAPAAFDTRFAPFLQQLRSVTIAKMIPIGCLLQELLQQQCDTGRPAFGFQHLPPRSFADRNPGANQSTNRQATNKQATNKPQA